jgi:hypothetical protein
VAETHLTTASKIVFSWTAISTPSYANEVSLLCFLIPKTLFKGSRCTMVLNVKGKDDYKKREKGEEE